MDTEEHIEIQEKLQKGHSQTDEGPYYHESWWESYKGSVKGKLGGVIIGALLGAVVGIAAAGVLALIVPSGLTFAAAAAVTGGFAAGGMVYAAHEFSDIGKVTGAVAAAHEKAEARMKAFEEGKFSELKTEINEVKSIVKGEKPADAATSQPPAAATTPEAKAPDEAEYRTTHFKDVITPPPATKPIFWKVALIGLAVGLAAGALLAFGGLSGHALELLGIASEKMSEAGIYAASMTTLGLFGASYGINRDFFRKIFDKTDLLFKGFITSKDKAPLLEINNPQVTVNATKIESPATTVVYEGHLDYPQSDTHHRDKVLAQAKQALLSMDHTKAVPH